MSALVLDAAALLAVDRNDRAMIARLAAAARHDLQLRTNAMVVAQVWRDQHGRQADLARLLRAIEVRSVDEATGRTAGVLLGLTRSVDAVDATVVLLAEAGDRILTSDPQDLTALAAAAANRAVIVAC